MLMSGGERPCCCLASSIACVSHRDARRKWNPFLQSCIRDLYCAIGDLMKSIIFFLVLLAMTAQSYAKVSKQPAGTVDGKPVRSEEHTSELQSRGHLVCR